MLQQCRTSSLVAGAMALLFSGVSAAEQCPKGEQPLEFRFFTDNNSWKDNGWILECDSKEGDRDLVWSIPIGSIEKASHTEVIREAACVPDKSTCTLNIFDAGSDGLQGSKNGKPGDTSFAGWFALLHGATTVATYKSLEDTEFSELTYCVGPDCDQEPQEVHKDCEDIVYLAMQLDNNPTDTSYQLVCGGEKKDVFDKQLIWNGNGFTEAGAFVEEETCLPKNACCEFIVVDGNSNGLTESVKKTRNSDGVQSSGYIYLEMNFDPVLEYDGSTGEEFGVLTKRFNCAADNDDKKKKKEEKDEEIKATAVVDAPESDYPNDEEDIKVGNNVEGVFDPEQEQVETAKDASKDEVFINADSTLGPSGTFPPTTEDWVSDDDYQNFNDDGSGFGSFEHDVGLGTEEPTIWASGTNAPISNDFSEDNAEDYWPRESWDLYDDVVDEGEDDTTWASIDDYILALEGQNEVESLIKDLDDHTIKLPTDYEAANMLNAQPVYADRTVGLTKNAKILIGVLVPLFLLWSIGLVACYYYGPKEEDKGGEDASKDEKGTTGDGESGASISEDSVV